MAITFEDFQAECLRLVETSPERARWRITFREEDFGREWLTDVTAGTHSALVRTFSASAGPTIAHDVLTQIDVILKELSSGA